MNLQIIKDLELIKEKLEKMKVKADKYDELMTPKKPTSRSYSFEKGYYGYCPKCDATVYPYQNHCHRCASALDWS